MKIPLHFGTDILHLDIPQGNIAAVLQPRHIETNHSDEEILSEAIITNQHALVQQVRGRTVGILLPDGTRDLPIESIFPPLLEALKSAGRFLFFICTGSHDPDTTENDRILEIIKSQVATAGIQHYEIVIHDCRKAAFSNAGVTQRGTEVLYNSRLDEVDVFCILSDIKHHYFAGYSNPVKNIAPGLCAFKTIERNHSLTFDSRSCAGIHPWHPDPTRRDNPLANDLKEVMQRIVNNRPIWALVTISHDKAIQWAALGPVEDVTAQAFQKTDAWNLRTVEKVDYMVVSPGGLPNDVDLYISQRALELTHTVVRDGGQILLLAACPGGIGSELTRKHFENKLTEAPTAILQQKPRDYHLFEHKPYRFAQLIQRLDKLWLHTSIPSNTVRRMHMFPTKDPQEVAAGWIRQQPESKILFVKGANKLLLKPRCG